MCDARAESIEFKDTNSEGKSAATYKEQLMTEKNPPAGWYVSPDDKNLTRWWDGDSWTDVAKAIPDQDMSKVELSEPDAVVKLEDGALPKPKAEQILDYVVGGALTAGGTAMAVDGTVNLVKKKTGAGKWFVIGLFLVAVSFLTGIQAVAGLFGPARTEVAGIVTTVTQDETIDSYCTPSAEYTVNAQTKSVKLWSSEECRWQVGDEVAVFFDEGTNGRNASLGKATEAWDNLFGSLATLVLGGILIIVGFVKLGARAAQAGVGALIAKKGYDKLKKTTQGK
jgi:hypothetical protein